MSILLFSMAGVPPFIGFFSKIFIMVLVLNNFYFVFYFIFFILLFLGLYFYMQNIRFLHSTNYRASYTPFLLNERLVVSMLYVTITILFMIVFGSIYTDDFILLFTWLFY
jgi:NADH:ubiquinone oxidoreductase subunit 2 (subunit N)